MAKATEWLHNGGTECEIEYNQQEQSKIEEWEDAFDMLKLDPDSNSIQAALDAIDDSIIEPVDFYSIDDKLERTVADMRKQANLIITAVNAVEYHLKKVRQRREAA